VRLRHVLGNVPLVDPRKTTRSGVNDPLGGRLRSHKRSESSSKTPRPDGNVTKTPGRVILTLPWDPSRSPFSSF